MAQQQELDQEAKWKAAPVHHPATFGYSRLGFEMNGHDSPFVECVCGWGSSPNLRWWQDVGEELDAHLKAMKAARDRE
jgi:hypothetical protein